MSGLLDDTSLNGTGRRIGLNQNVLHEGSKPSVDLIEERTLNIARQEKQDPYREAKMEVS